MDLLHIVRDKIILIKEYCQKLLSEEIDLSGLPDLVKDLIMDYKRQLDWKDLNVEYHRSYEWSKSDYLSEYNVGEYNVLKCRKCGHQVANWRPLSYSYSHNYLLLKILAYGCQILRLKCLGCQGNMNYHFNKEDNFDERILLPQNY